MEANEMNSEVIRCAVYLAVALKADHRDVAEYIDYFPEFLLNVFDHTWEEPDDLLSEFLMWITANGNLWQFGAAVIERCPKGWAA
jgi:hypothetical protein